MTRVTADAGPPTHAHAVPDPDSPRRRRTYGQTPARAEDTQTDACRGDGEPPTAGACTCRGGVSQTRGTGAEASLLRVGCVDVPRTPHNTETPGKREAKSAGKRGVARVSETDGQKKKIITSVRENKL